MSEKTHHHTGGRGGLGIGGAVFIVFLVLKLMHVIDWSWWWITAPLWGGAALSIVTILACFAAAVIAISIKEARKP